MQEFNLSGEDEVVKIIKGNLQRMFSSSNINLLLGSAFSIAFLKTLSNVELRLSEAVENGNREEEYRVKKEFFDNSILPILNINFESSEFEDNLHLIKTLADIVDLRETSVVHKIINVFTTNYDNLIEMALEKNHIDYFDGFGGRINPEFSTSNYGKLMCKHTELTGRVSETMSVNLFKIHGSVYWKQQNDKIVFEDCKDRIMSISKAESKEEFLKKYNSLAIVNPEKNKFNSTVMNSNYYDQIRMFANELERQNTILMTFGFSFADEHIMHILSRALSSNPTFTLLVFPFCQKDLERFRELFKFNNNVFCYFNMKDEIEGIEKFCLSDMNHLLVEIYNGVK